MRFQFYLVRLKVADIANTLVEAVFQFYLVRLKAEIRKHLIGIDFKFQFYLVRLKDLQMLHWMHKILFQFYLVRLKGIIYDNTEYFTLVSILLSAIKSK